MKAPNAIGIVAPQLSGVYFAEILRGIQSVTSQRYQRLIGFQGTPHDLHVTRLAVSHIAGWIVITAGEGIEQLALDGKPFVAIGVETAAQLCPVVSPDNHGGMQAAVTHLLTLGHRQIGFVGSLGQSDIAQRYDGYLAAYTEQGLKVPSDLCIDLSAGTINIRELIQRLKQHEVNCTAIAAATDETALMLISAIQEAGFHVPSDLAVVGFDDIILAQAASPPLTTVRYSIEALGRTAAELLLAKIAGEQVAHQRYVVSTALIHRQSCGGRTDQTISITSSMHGVEPDWQAQLVSELIQQIYIPGTPPPDPQLAWPSSALLVQSLAAALDGHNPDIVFDLTNVWRDAVAICGDYATLLSLNDLLDRWGREYLVSIQGDQAAQLRLRQFLQQSRIELVHNIVSSQINLLIAVLTFPNQSVNLSIALLGDTRESPRQLDWLRFTSFLWGCLAFWQPAHQELQVVSQYRPAHNSALPLHYPPSDFPDDQLLSNLPEAGDLVLLLPIRTTTCNWGILVLTATVGYLYSSASYDALKPIQTLLGTALDREALELDLRQAAEHTQFLTTTIHELSCPVIPLFPGVVLIPLIGAIDMMRAQTITESTLVGITTHHASTIILDITGVPMIDTQIAQALVQTARAATLLGAKVALVGIRPEIAQSLVSLGAELHNIATYASLATALAALPRR